MTDVPDAVRTALAASFSRIFGHTAALDANATSQTIAGWDSFKYVQVILEMETRFGIELDGPDIDEVANFGDFVGLISRKIAERSGQ